MVRVHQEKVLRKGRKEQVEESFAILVKILGLVKEHVKDWISKTTTFQFMKPLLNK